MTDQSRRWWNPPYVGLCVADATRWFAWWLMKALVEWGSLLCGNLQASTEWKIDMPPPRPLRHEIGLRTEIDRGLAHLEAYLSATSPEDATKTTEDGTGRTRSEGGSS